MDYTAEKVTRPFITVATAMKSQRLHQPVPGEGSDYRRKFCSYLHSKTYLKPNVHSLIAQLQRNG